MFSVALRQAASVFYFLVAGGCGGVLAMSASSEARLKPVGGGHAGATLQRSSSDSDSLPIRGITVSTHGGGREWGDPKIMSATFDELVKVGANWVAIHPYARIAANGSVTPFVADPMLAGTIELAQQRGLQILIKPHLAYWGSPFSWRGEITFSSPENWQRFFSTYESWIVSVAEATVGADAFAVGTELDKTVEREDNWRSIISAIKAVNGAALTYAANWTDYHRVPFWDTLDAVGIQAYFPLSSEERPSERELREAWSERMKSLAAFSEQWGKPILFTELGYSRTWSAAREPWLAKTEEQASESLQRDCLRVALQAVEAEPTVVGSFLWKWFPEPRPVGRDFQMAAPGVREELRSVWSVDVAGDRD